MNAPLNIQCTFRENPLSFFELFIFPDSLICVSSFLLDLGIFWSFNQCQTLYHHSFSVPTTPEVSRIFWPILNKFYVNYGFSTSSEFFYFKSYHNTKNLRISHVVQRFSWLKTIWQFDDILDRSVIEKKKLSTIKVQLFKLFWQIAFCSALQFWLPKWRRNFKTILIFH